MSIESAKLFIKKINSNLDFSNKVAEFGDTKEFWDFIVKEGFEFTGKELEEADIVVSEGNNQELSDDNLAKICGGGSGSEWMMGMERAKWISAQLLRKTLEEERLEKERLEREKGLLP